MTWGMRHVAAALLVVLGCMRGCSAEVGRRGGKRSLLQGDTNGTEGALTATNDQCTPSPRDSFQCMLQVLGDVQIHWSLEPEVLQLRMRAEAPDLGYLAMGWASLDANNRSRGMADAEVVVGSVLPSGLPSVGTYRLGTRGRRSAVRTPIFFIRDIGVASGSGRTVLRFTRDLDPEIDNGDIYFDPAEPSNLILSYGAATAYGAPESHRPEDRWTAQINFETGEASVKLPVHPLQFWHLLHGFLMGGAWGVLVPFAIIGGRWFRHHKAWFTYHRGLGLLAVAASAGAWAVAWIKFETATWHRHRVLGLVMLAVLGLQPVNGSLRPAKVSRYRRYWEFVHLLLGRGMAAAGVINCYFGMRRYDEMYWGDDAEMAYAAVAGWVALLAVAGCVMEFRLARSGREASYFSRWVYQGGDTDDEEEEGEALMGEDGTTGSLRVGSTDSLRGKRGGTPNGRGGGTPKGKTRGGK